MIITPENIARHELIGLQVEATGPGLAGVSGMIVDETRNTFLIEAARGVIRVPKSHASLVFTLPDGRRVKVSGSILISQPENRISKRIQRARWKI
ncbi:MAG TPA: ribonuclease P protein component 1 [Methanotrichaceae archaeon]|nr:ribonuclease P protein component 1 [Methanotrichaceae archaeon]